jgi:hypothetical protein
VLLDNVEEYGSAIKATGDITGHMGCACFISTDTGTDKICNAYCFPQQWLRERALLLRAYVHCLSC